jgi:hypothetical protein
VAGGSDGLGEYAKGSSQADPVGQTPSAVGDPVGDPVGPTLCAVGDVGRQDYGGTRGAGSSAPGYFSVSMK